MRDKSNLFFISLFFWMQPDLSRLLREFRLVPRLVVDANSGALERSKDPGSGGTPIITGGWRFL